MRKLYLFMMVSADGFFEGKNHSLDWHNVDKEFDEFAIGQLRETGAILFGRRTYEMMAGFWPTDKAKAEDPAVAGYMNSLPKYVFSTTLAKASWNNTKLINGNLKREITKLKKGKGGEIAVFGSSNLSVSLIKDGLIDEFRLMVNPVFLGAGTPLFHGLSDRLRMKLLRTKAFKSGNMLLYYQFVPKNKYEKDNRDGVRDS